MRAGNNKVNDALVMFYIFVFCVGLDLRSDDMQAYNGSYLPAQTWIRSVILRRTRHIVLVCACMLVTVYLHTGRRVLYENSACPEQISGVQWKHTVTSRPTWLCPPRFPLYAVENNWIYRTEKCQTLTKLNRPAHGSMWEVSQSTAVETRSISYPSNV